MTLVGAAQVLTFFTKPQFWLFHVAVLLMTANKWRNGQKWKDARAERAKLLILLTKYANVSRSCCRRRCRCLIKLINTNLDPRALLLTEGEKSSREPWNKLSSLWFSWRTIKASLIGAFMLERGVSRRRKVQIANFWLQEPYGACSPEPCVDPRLWWREWLIANNHVLMGMRFKSKKKKHLHLIYFKF